MAKSQIPTLSLLAQRVAALNSEIEMIFADADRRAAPLRAKLQRLQIAEEELRDLDPDLPALAHVGAPVVALTPGASLAQKKKSIRALIEEELKVSALPLSKAEFVERFAASGHAVQESTVGSTLSRLVADGVLSKGGTNRYVLRADAVQQTNSVNGKEEDL